MINNFYYAEIDDKGVAIATRKTNTQFTPTPDNYKPLSKDDYDTWTANLAAKVWLNGAMVDAPKTLAAALAELSAYRYSREIAGISVIVQGNSYTVATDRESQSKITSAFTLTLAGIWVDGTKWKMADGRFVGLSSDDIKLIASKSVKYVSDCYTHESELATELLTNTSVDIKSGWPSN